MIKFGANLQKIIENKEQNSDLDCFIVFHDTIIVLMFV